MNEKLTVHALLIIMPYLGAVEAIKIWLEQTFLELLQNTLQLFQVQKVAQKYPMVWQKMYSNLFQVVPPPLHCKTHKGAQATFFCNLTVQKAYKSSLKNAHKSGYWMCEIGEKIKPQFKVDLIQFVNATTYLLLEKNLLLKVLLWWAVIQKTTWTRYHIQKLTKANNFKLETFTYFFQRPLIGFISLFQKGFSDKYDVVEWQLPERWLIDAT